MNRTNTYASNVGDKNTVTDLPDNQHDLDRLKGETVILDLPEVKDIPGQEHIKVMPLGAMADTTISSADEEGAGILDFDEGPVGIEDEEDFGTDRDNSVVIDAGDEDDLADDDIDDVDEDDADLLNDDDPEEDYEGEDFITEDDEGDFDEDEDVDEDDDADLDDEEEDDDDLPAASSNAGIVSGTALSGSFDESAKDDREAADAEISEEEISMLENSGPVERDSDTDNLNRSKLDNTDLDGELLNEVTSTQNVDGNDLDVPGAEFDDANEAIGEEDEENNVYSMPDTEGR